MPMGSFHILSGGPLYPLQTKLVPVSFIWNRSISVPQFFRIQEDAVVVCIRNNQC